MKMTFRWYGENDPVSLKQIRQVPNVNGVVCAVYDVAPGKLWSDESILKIKNAANAENMSFETVESVPVHEDIKLGSKNSNTLLDIYCENIRRLSKHGVKCICYNFMPVFDWFRSDLKFIQEDGSNSLAYIDESVEKMNPKNNNVSLPGWDESYSKSELSNLLNKYSELGEEGLWKNVQNFLEAVIPVAKESGINMAIHPDDPPWSIFGLPRIITNKKNLDRFLKLYDDETNGLTFCTGSLGAGRDNNLPEMIRCFEGRIHFAHIRNIKHFGKTSFCETAHSSNYGSLDMYEIVKALVDTGFDGYVRPDHGRMIWGETGKPGYGLYDRALGAMYVSGLFEACEKNK